jgi:mannitol/fructose-specific phosphotransferase system IIA component
MNSDLIQFEENGQRKPETPFKEEVVENDIEMEEPIEFEALDGEPVNLIFLLVGKEDAVGQHLKMLSRISRIMNQENIRKKLANAESSEEILQIFDEEDSKYLELS